MAIISSFRTINGYLYKNLKHQVLLVSIKTPRRIHRYEKDLKPLEKMSAIIDKLVPGDYKIILDRQNNL